MSSWLQGSIGWWPKLPQNCQFAVERCGRIRHGGAAARGAVYGVSSDPKDRMGFLLLSTLTAVLLAAHAALPQQVSSKSFSTQTAASYAGFDRNVYPGDAALPELRKHFDFVGYWLTDPPGESKNTWVGKRGILLLSLIHI